MQTIRKASKAGLGSKEISKLVPRDVFLGEGRSYLIESATRGNFSAEVLDEIEHPSEHS